MEQILAQLGMYLYTGMAAMVGFSTVTVWIFKTHEKGQK